MSEENKKPEPVELPPVVAAFECPDGVVIPGPELPNGDALCIGVHDGEVHTGVLHKMRSGEPIPDDARFVSPMKGTPLYELGESVAELKAGKGPAKVTSNAYRHGYDAIQWSKRDCTVN